MSINNNCPIDPTLKTRGKQLAPHIELFFNHLYSNNVSQIEQLLTEPSIYSEITPQLKELKGYTALHICCILGNTEIVQRLLYHFLHNLKLTTVDFTLVDKQMFTCVHYLCNEGHVDILDLLLNELVMSDMVDKQKQIDLNLRCLITQTNDTVSYIGGFSSMPLYTTGGKTPFHYCAETGNLQCAELVYEYVVKYGNEAMIHKILGEDFDGNTPLELAIISKQSTEFINKIFEMINIHNNNNSNWEEWQEKLLSTDYVEGKKKERKGKQEQRLQQRQLAKSKLTQQIITEKYERKHEELFELRDSFFDLQFLQATSTTTSSLDTILTKECEGVYSFPMMSIPNFCNLLISEMENYESSGLPVERPNSMNNYGLILNDIGLYGMLFDLMKRHIEPIAKHLFPDYDYDFHSHHSFIVRYKIGEDVDLDEHVDDSDITVNLSLGYEFTGGEVYFKGMKGKRDEQKRYFEYNSVPSRAVIHMGKHVHGSKPLTSGTRVNLIMWCRNRSL